VEESEEGRKGAKRSEKTRVPEEGGPGIQRLKTYELLCAYLHETTNIKYAESRPRLVNTWKCRGY
jgi:hypothetical protein